MSSVIVAKASVILAFNFVISGTGVENTLSLTYARKRSQVKGGDIRRSWWPGRWTISSSPPVWKCCTQKPTNMWTPQCGGAPSCWKIFETNLMVKKKYIFIPRTFLIINVCNQGKNLCSPCTAVVHNNHSKIYVSEGVYFFCEDSVHSERIGFEFKSSYWYMPHVLTCDFSLDLQLKARIMTCTYNALISKAQLILRSQ